ncbi:DUF6690 family protein [Novipirellula galeiformis]|nr:DUF6690 family protein [Novipirellula galeiformis]
MRIRTAAAIAALVGGPYVASETEMGRETVTTIKQQFQTSEVANLADNALLSQDTGYGIHSHYEVEQLRHKEPSRYRYDHELARKLGAIPAAAEQEPTLFGATVDDIREVLRFDIGSEWVINRFTRVTTVLADLNMEGLRVPIVTGTKADDLAGTLTYYFDTSGKVQRITIHGFTGDPSKMVAIMTEHYGLAREPSLEAGVYTRRWNGQPVQFFRLTHAPVVYSDAIHQKYTVFVELNQPNLAFGISPEAQRIMNSDHYSGRW